MRIFGSKVIALEKKPFKGKFEPKGKEYVLVGYSQESKAYRLWTPGTKTVMKRRDVRFIEDLESQTSSPEENYGVLPNLNWNESTESIDAKPTEPIIVHEDEDEDEESNDVTLEQESSEESEEDREEEQTATPIISKRCSGRPKLLKTGKRGRPRKLYREMRCDKETSHEPSNVEEINNRTDKQA